MLCNINSLIAQKIENIEGIVQDKNGPVDGCLVLGPTVNDYSNINGKFSIPSAEVGDTILFSYVGYDNYKLIITNEKFYTITLNSNFELEQVVVSALGIKRSAKSLSSSIQKVDAKELTRVKDVNFVNALSGKTPGVSIQRSSGAGGAVRVVLRGNKSITGNNEPLYIVDGFPISNSKPSSGVLEVSGDGISNLNPDDIASMSIIKGATAAALYGSEASNGVVLITTKSGTKGGKTEVSISSLVNFEVLSYSPEFQTKYGRGVNENRDEQLNGSPGNLSLDNGNGYAAFSSTPLEEEWTHPWSSFLNTGTTFINSVGVSTSGENYNAYVSYAKTDAEGIVPGNKVGRDNIGLNLVVKPYGDKVEFGVKVNYIDQLTENTLLSGQYLQSPLANLYVMTPGIDWQYYSTNYEKNVSSVSGASNQNWHQPLKIESSQNPWALVNNVYRPFERKRYLIGSFIKYNILDNLYVQIRWSNDQGYDNIEERAKLGISWRGRIGKGFYSKRVLTSSVKYTEGIANYSIKLPLLGSDDGQVKNKNLLNVLVGSSNKSTESSENNTSLSNLEVVNFFRTGSYSSNDTGAERINTEYYSLINIQSYFASLNYDIENIYFLDLSYRIDQSNALEGLNSFFSYPSVGGSIVLSELSKSIFDTDLSEASINFLKIRGGYTIVGNGVPSIAIKQFYKTLDAPFPDNKKPYFINSKNTTPTQDPSIIEPELTSTLEIGAELKLFEGRMNFDFNWYDSRTTNQFINLDPVNIGFSALGASLFANGGEVQNSGIEILVTSNNVQSNFVNWSTTVNFSQNKNKVISLYGDKIKEYNLPGSISSLQSKVVVGETYGGVYGPKLNITDDGYIVTSRTGPDTYRFDTKNEFIANSTPLFKLGLQNSFGFNLPDIGKINIGFLIDGSFGGEVISWTQAFLDGKGLSKSSADLKDKGTIDVKIMDKTTGEKKVETMDANTYLQAKVGGISGFNAGLAYDDYIYDATVIRLRELSFSYTLPKELTENWYVKNISISLNARNLFYFYKPAPFDSELTVSQSNGLQGIDIFTLPSSLSFGGGISMNF